MTPERVYCAAVLTEDEMPAPWVKVGEKNGSPVWVAPLGTRAPDTDRKISAVPLDAMAR